MRSVTSGTLSKCDDCSQIPGYTAIGVLEAEDTENSHWAKKSAALLI